MAEPNTTKSLSSYARITLMLAKGQVGEITLNEPGVDSLMIDIAIQFLKLGSDLGMERDLNKLTVEINHLDNIKAAIVTANVTAPNKVNTSKLADSTKFRADQTKYLNEIKEVRQTFTDELRKKIDELNRAPDTSIYFENVQKPKIRERISIIKNQIDQLNKTVNELEKQINSGQKQGIAAYKEIYNAEAFPRQTTPDDLAKSIKRTEPTTALPTEAPTPPPTGGTTPEQPHRGG